MKNLIFLLSVILSVNSAMAFSIMNNDARAKDSKYLQKVLKEEEKEKYERKKLNYKPSGYMTTQEYEALSQYKDKTEDKIEIPKVKESGMKYVPQPTYKIVRYNDPPGSVELNISNKFYKLNQYNGQGITSPDYTMMVYPVVYYYPNSASTASDLFVIELEQTGSPLEKIQKAHVSKRLPDPIISTDKSVANDYAFRTLTPVDFSADSSKLLAKEKIGSSKDGIWQTNAIVYDFEKQTSYKLSELREAIVYYWKTNKNIDLDEYRWDITPLGFMKTEPYRVVATAYAYTGNKPIFLGTWSVDSRGQQTRLISLKNSDIELSINGFKIVQDGVVSPIIIENEEKNVKKSEKIDAKNAKKHDKEVYKQMKNEYKEKIKEINNKFKNEQSEFTKQNKLNGTTTLNDIPEQYQKLKEAEQQKQELKNQKKTPKIKK